MTRIAGSFVALTGKVGFRIIPPVSGAAGPPILALLGFKTIFAYHGLCSHSNERVNQR